MFAGSTGVDTYDQELKHEVDAWAREQQPAGAGVVVSADRLPPAADRGDGERRRVVIGADADPAGVRRHVVDSGIALAAWPGKSCVLTLTGCPAGCHSCPAFLQSPISSFFLLSTLITGSPASLWSRARSLRQRNWASLSGCWAPSTVLALACRLKPSSRSRPATVSAETRCPWRVSSADSFRVDFVVQRSGDIGSPRSSGSTSASSAGRSPESSTAAFFRPPPGGRTRPNRA